MDSVWDYVRSTAPDDVRRTVQWLLGEGYALTASSRGESESFGNALLVFTRGTEITITRDRSQWVVTVALSPGATPMALDVLNCARLGETWDPSPRRTLTRPLPEQLPEGLAWAETLPLVLAWLDQPGTASTAAGATEAARERMRRWWDEPAPD
jgi:hypothetical protein